MVIKNAAMKLLIDIKDDKLSFMMELLESFEFVKTEAVSTPADQILSDISEGVEELKQIKAGKQKAVSLNEFLREL